MADPGNINDSKVRLHQHDRLAVRRQHSHSTASGCNDIPVLRHLDAIGRQLDGLVEGALVGQVFASGIDIEGVNGPLAGRIVVDRGRGVDGRVDDGEASAGVGQVEDAAVG